MARLLLSALRDGGHDVELASRFRAWDGTGDDVRQRRLAYIGSRLGQRLLRRYVREAAAPDLWFTYHLYHKAPDWIGPVVVDALDIPYVVAEASYAPKQNKGPWQVGQEQCRRCLSRARALISLNDQDIPCLQTVVKQSCLLLDLKPFLRLPLLAAPDVRLKLARERGIPEQATWLVCVAMMRPGDKLASFTRLASALQQLLDQSWHLIIVGDGVARHLVEECFAPLRQRTTMIGLLDQRRVFGVLKACDVYVWPAVNEAYGMALLEAQACGLPVVASAVGGVARVVAHERTGLLAAANDEKSLVAHIRRLIARPELRRKMGAEAVKKCQLEHDYVQAVTLLADTFRQLKA